MTRLTMTALPLPALRRVYAGLCAAVLLSALQMSTVWAEDAQPSRPNGQTAISKTSPGAAATVPAYKPDDFLSLDLKAALLSPAPLGPPARFEPYSVEAKTDNLPNSVRVSRTPPAAAAAQTAETRGEPSPQAERAASRSTAAKPHTRQAARRHGNPLDAQARDTRAPAKATKSKQPAKIQTWPCRSGGICGWGR